MHASVTLWVTQVQAFFWSDLEKRMNKFSEGSAEVVTVHRPVTGHESVIGTAGD